MSPPPDQPPLGFSDLRQVAIQAAQDASGQIWTDYNLHDPGVTLLEQTCFALSELVYQARHDMRDLMTAGDDRFKTEELALFDPRSMLATGPVTCADMAAWLSEQADIASATVTLDPSHPGLYKITVIPAEDQADADLEAKARAAFDKIRPLCCDLGALKVATKIKVILRGSVEIMPNARPEEVAAHLYHAVSVILRGQSPARAEPDQATRADAYLAPERLFALSSGQSHPTASGNEAQAKRGTRSAASRTAAVAPEISLQAHLVDLQQLEGVRDISRLALRVHDGSADDVDGPVYFASMLPRTSVQIELELTLGGAPLGLDPDRIREEYIKASARVLSRAHDHIDKADWDVLRPGRHRRFDQSHVDALLPAVYRATGYDHADPDLAMTRYRHGIDGLLQDLAAALDQLPTTFSARTAASTHDPKVHRQRIAALDHLIAIYGSEMPEIRHSGLNVYRGAREAHAFEIDWRLRYLYALPRLHLNRGTGPSADHCGGFLEAFGILADLKTDGIALPPDLLGEFGVSLDDAAIAPPDPVAMSVPSDVFDMLVPTRKADLLSSQELHNLLPFAERGRITPEIFAAFVTPRGLLLSPTDEGRWQLILASEPCHRLGEFPDQAAAQTAVQQLRQTMRHLHEGCEGAVLVEDVKIRRGTAYHPHRADLVLPGFTARTARDSYRRYVERLVVALAPAHVLINVHWLDYGQMKRLRPLYEAAQKGGAERRAELRHFLDGLSA